MKNYLERLEFARTAYEVNRILSEAANDDRISNSEYEFIYSTAIYIKKA